MIRVAPFGTTSPVPGRPATEVRVVELTSSVLAVRLLTLGAAIASVEAPDAEGRTGDVHLSLPTVADYEDPARNPHLGASIGRYANRIAGARFPLDGSEVRVVANDGPNQLHGGPVGFDRHVWELVSTEDGDDGGTAVFRFVSSNGDQGFPGTVTVGATYELRGDSLWVAYRSTTDAPTVVNMTNHGYWNLDGSDTVDDHLVSIAASRYLPVDDAGIPTGGLEPVDGTVFDLRDPTRLGRAMVASPTGGFDHCFAIDGPVGELRPAAVLEAPASGRWMTVATNRPGVQLYTGDHLADPFPVHASVSLETQRFPDTPNRPELGSAELRPGDLDESFTVLRFGSGHRNLTTMAALGDAEVSRRSPGALNPQR